MTAAYFRSGIQPPVVLRPINMYPDNCATRIRAEHDAFLTYVATCAMKYDTATGAVADWAWDLEGLVGRNYES